MIVSKSMDKNYLTEMTNGVEGVAPVLADIPTNQGGGGANMRPGELLLSGWAACMNITARKYLNRDKLPYDRVIVRVDVDREKAGVSRFYSDIEIDGALTDADRERIIAEVKSCPVCDTLARTAEFLDLE